MADNAQLLQELALKIESARVNLNNLLANQNVIDTLDDNLSQDNNAAKNAAKSRNIKAIRNPIINYLQVGSNITDVALLELLTTEQQKRQAKSSSTWLTSFFSASPAKISSVNAATQKSLREYDDATLAKDIDKLQAITSAKPLRNKRRKAMKNLSFNQVLSTIEKDISQLDKIEINNHAYQILLPLLDSLYALQYDFMRYSQQEDKRANSRLSTLLGLANKVINKIAQAFTVDKIDILHDGICGSPQQEIRIRANYNKQQKALSLLPDTPAVKQLKHELTAAIIEGGGSVTEDKPPINLESIAVKLKDIILQNNYNLTSEQIFKLYDLLHACQEQLLVDIRLLQAASYTKDNGSELYSVPIAVRNKYLIAIAEGMESLSNLSVHKMKQELSSSASGVQKDLDLLQQLGFNVLTNEARVAWLKEAYKLNNMLNSSTSEEGREQLLLSYRAHVEKIIEDINSALEHKVYNDLAQDVSFNAGRTKLIKYNSTLKDERLNDLLSEYQRLYANKKVKQQIIASQIDFYVNFNQELTRTLALTAPLEQDGLKELISCNNAIVTALKEEFKEREKLLQEFNTKFTTYNLNIEELRKDVVNQEMQLNKSLAWQQAQDEVNNFFQSRKQELASILGGAGLSKVVFATLVRGSATTIAGQLAPAFAASALLGVGLYGAYTYLAYSNNNQVVHAKAQEIAAKLSPDALIAVATAQNEAQTPILVAGPEAMIDASHQVGAKVATAASKLTQALTPDASALVEKITGIPSPNSLKEFADDTLPQVLQKVGQYLGSDTNEQLQQVAGVVQLLVSITNAIESIKNFFRGIIHFILHPIDGLKKIFNPTNAMPAVTVVESNNGKENATIIDLPEATKIKLKEFLRTIKNSEVAPEITDNLKNSIVLLIEIVKEQKDQQDIPWLDRTINTILEAVKNNDADKMEDCQHALRLAYGQVIAKEDAIQDNRPDSIATPSAKKPHREPFTPGASHTDGPDSTPIAPRRPTL